MPNPDVTPVSMERSTSVTEAIETRRSVREFTQQPVPCATLRRVVEVSARAASGGNIQPWKVYVLNGQAKDRVVSAVRHKIKTEGTFQDDDLEYDIYPLDMRNWEGDRARYMRNRRELGYEMYSLMGIERTDQKGRIEAMLKNFDFFGAPVGLLITIDRGMGPPQWHDLGCFLTNFMLLCREEGLHTCAQEAWATFPKTVKAAAGIDDDEILFCGVAVGYADSSAVVNTLRSKRSPMHTWATFSGFEQDCSMKSKL